MAALEYVHLPKYSALILRRDFARLSLPNSIMDRAKQWLYKTDAQWNSQSHTFRFPSGAVIQFGYIDNPDDRFRYASAEFQFLAFDELTEFRLQDDDSNPYLFMFSRLRKTADNPAPLRVRAASNPGNEGHEFVRRRFISDQAAAALISGDSSGVYYSGGRAFVPALLADNPAINAEDYTASLMHLPPMTRARLLRGDWLIRPDGLLREDWIRRYEMRNDILLPLGKDGQRLASIDCRELHRFATIDTAGTSEEKAKERKGKPPSWSVCQIWDYWSQPRWLFLRHVWRKRVDWSGLKAEITETLDQWNPQRTLIENAHYGAPLASELTGFSPELMGTKGKGKAERSTALQNMLSKGQVFLPGNLVPGVMGWVPDLESEWLSWTGHDEETADQIDTASMAANYVSEQYSSWGGVLPVTSRVTGMGGW